MKLKNPHSDIFDSIKFSKKNLIELAKLSSKVHKEPHYVEYEYLGSMYEYMSLFIDKEFRIYPEIKFHIVLIKANKNFEFQLDRIFVYNTQTREPFLLYNISNGKLIEVKIYQFELFDMFKYIQDVVLSKVFKKINKS